MTTQEILSFCRSIDVHPAHLIPFDNDNRLSLPTPLLELLIEMAYNGNASHGLDSNDVYLARAAIALECKRIQKHKEEQRSLAVENNDGLSRLSQAFIDVLNDPKARKDISKTTIVSPSSCFAAEASRSYPYIDRVHDITVIQEEAELEKSIHSKKLKEQVYLYRVNRLVDIYQKLFHQSSRSPIEAQDFLMDIVDEIEMQQAADLRAPSIDEIAKMFAKLMGQQGKLRKGYDAANDIYIEKFGLRSGGNSEADEAFLKEFEFEFYHDLFVGIHGFFEARSNLFRHRIRHEELEGVYILKVGRIRDAFDKVCKPYERNLLNNRVLLSLHNIDLKKERAPLATPK
jgi:hypothetical protein